jgi:integrase
VYCRREALTPGGKPFPLLGATKEDLAAAFARRCQLEKAGRAGEVMQVRDGVLADAGALTYKMIRGEFTKVAGTLGWPAAATLKDFRHGCNTALANGGIPEHERRYLVGHHPGKGAIVAYTHLNQLAEHYRLAAERELGLLDVLRRRAA